MYAFTLRRCTDDDPIFSFFVVDQGIFFSATLRRHLRLYFQNEARRVLFLLLDTTHRAPDCNIGNRSNRIVNKFFYFVVGSLIRLALNLRRRSSLGIKRRYFSYTCYTVHTLHNL